MSLDLDSGLASGSEAARRDSVEEIRQKSFIMAVMRD